MQIDLTPDEYKTLVKLLFIGNFITNGNRTSDDDKWDNKSEDLLEKVFSKYKDFKADKLIVFIKELDKHFIASPYDLEFFNMIDEYVDKYYDDEQGIDYNISRLKDEGLL